MLVLNNSSRGRRGRVGDCYVMRAETAYYIIEIIGATIQYS